MRYSFLSFLIAWIFPTKKDRAKFRRFCSEIDLKQDTKKIWARYPKLIKHLQNQNLKRKLKVVFLSSENSKWVYQTLYEEFVNDSKFEVQVLVTVREDWLNKKYNFLEYEKEARNNYNKFKARKINVAYAFDFKRKRYKDLKIFKPDIIFYEQPWALSNTQGIKKTSKYALPFYCAYGSCITNGTNEYSESFYRDVYTYFIDNECVKHVLLDNGCREQALVVSGQPKLDAYLKPINKKNIVWKSQNKKRVIYAPHHSFYKDSILGFGTFSWNYTFFYNLAKNHPEIEFIIKPHPELKKQIVNQGVMSIKEMTQYFEKWKNLPNAQVYEYGDYFDIFRTSDLLITDCNSFLYEYLPTLNPVIHLIGKYSVGHNDFGQKIISGYYPAKNIEELKAQLDLVLFKGEDPLKVVRKKVIKNDLIQPECGVARFISSYITQILRKEDHA